LLIKFNQQSVFGFVGVMIIAALMTVAFWTSPSSAAGKTRIHWKSIAGAATDISVGADGSVWVVGTNKVNGGFGIYRWNANTWIRVSGGATRIDVGPKGNAWIVNSQGNIYRYNGKKFVHVPGKQKARDIGIGANGDIWILGFGGYFKWTGKAWKNMQKGWPGHAIDVAPDGNAWVIDAKGGVSHFDGKAFQTAHVKAIDVSIGADGAVWAVNQQANSEEGGSPMRWNGKSWDWYSDKLQRIAVDANGLPWGITAKNKIVADTKSAALTHSASTATAPTKPTMVAISAIKNLTWVKTSGGKVPANVVLGARVGNNALGICRAFHKNGQHPGKIFRGKCNIGWGGKEIAVPKFEALVVK
jgi:hypothetical protein